MRIVLASSEAVPFSKTGGLADVASALAKALARIGHEVWLVTPHYPQVMARNRSAVPRVEPTGRSVTIRIGAKAVTGELLRAELPGSNVTVLLVDQPDYYDRPQLYTENGTDYRDNCERFVFFGRAVLESARVLQIRPDVLHLNDWQTGLVPALLQIESRGRDPDFERTASVFTIHNMAYQGQFWHWDMALTGLDWKYFNWRQMEYHDALNLLKTGIVFSDVVTTVSPTYSREIQTEEFGCGLERVLASRSEDLFGILNGVDLEVWNPATDPHLSRNYTVETVADGKPACKEDLQRRMGLAVRPDVPLLGMISRLADQKGLDLIEACIDDLVQQDLQLCFLGTGDPVYEKLLEKLAADSPQKVAAYVDFDEALAHRIEAGADAFLMPSRYEPCGLNQMYSMLYGTVPVVRSVGGLADSVVDATQQTLANGTATGFRFSRHEGTALFETIQRALGLYRERDRWMQLVRTGMRQDWSWDRSAREYAQVYERAVSRTG